MERIYEQSKDLHIRNLVAYGKASDHTLWADAEFTNYLEAEVVKNAFLKDMLIILDNTTYKKPVSLDASNKYVTAEVVSSAVSLVEWTVAVAD